MNINAVRKRYENLTLLQRLSLADNAIGRNDEGEALAINAASPRVAFTQPDFMELYNDILHIRLCNLITRLGYIINFDFILECDLDRLINKSKAKNERRVMDDLRLAAFLYVRATDSGNSVNDELGLRTNFDEEIGELLLAYDLFRSKDALMRQVAFSEDEARRYIHRRTGEAEIRTIEQEIDGYREILGLKKAELSVAK
jgi:hypothetical protein